MQEFEEIKMDLNKKLNQALVVSDELEELKLEN